MDVHYNVRIEGYTKESTQYHAFVGWLKRADKPDLVPEDGDVIFSVEIGDRVPVGICVYSLPTRKSVQVEGFECIDPTFAPLVSAILTRHIVVDLMATSMCLLGTNIDIVGASNTPRAVDVLS